MIKFILKSIIHISLSFAISFLALLYINNIFLPPIIGKDTETPIQHSYNIEKKDNKEYITIYNNNLVYYNRHNNEINFIDLNSNNNKILNLYKEEEILFIKNINDILYIIGRHNNILSINKYDKDKNDIDNIINLKLSDVLYIADLVEYNNSIYLNLYKYNKITFNNDNLIVKVNLKTYQYSKIFINKYIEQFYILKGNYIYLDNNNNLWINSEIVELPIKDFKIVGIVDNQVLLSNFKEKRIYYYDIYKKEITAYQELIKEPKNIKLYNDIIYCIYDNEILNHNFIISLNAPNITDILSINEDYIIYKTTDNEIKSVKNIGVKNNDFQ